MNELGKKSFFQEHKKLIFTHLIISASLSLISILVLGLLAPELDGPTAVIMLGSIFAFSAFILHFSITMGLGLFRKATYGKILSIGFVTATVVIVLAFAIISGISNDNTIGYKSGDYSQYACEDCGNPADGGRFHLPDTPDRYYCAEHYIEREKSHDDASQKVSCKLCGKKFDKNSLDGENIEKDNYCIDCEADLIGFDKVWGD